MKIYLIDCDSYSRRELTHMIEGEELGEVAGVSAGTMPAGGFPESVRM